MYHKKAIYKFVKKKTAKKPEELCPGVGCRQVWPLQHVPQEGHLQVRQEEDCQEGREARRPLRREEGWRCQERRNQDGSR